MGKLLHPALFTLLTMIWWAVALVFLTSYHNGLTAIALCIPCIIWANIEPHIEDRHDS